MDDNLHNEQQPDIPVLSAGQADAAQPQEQADSGLEPKDQNQNHVQDQDLDQDAEGEEDLQVEQDLGQSDPSSIEDSFMQTNPMPITKDGNPPNVEASTPSQQQQEQKQQQQQEQEQQQEQQLPLQPSFDTKPEPQSISVLGKRSTFDADQTSTPTSAPTPVSASAQPYSQPSASLEPTVLPSAQTTADVRKNALEDRIQKEPRDGEAWLALIEGAQNREDMQETRDLYERFFQVFPNQGRQWIAYADLELAHSNFPQVEAIFTKCLRSTPSVDLWKFYLSYTRRVNPLPPPSGVDEDGPREQARRTLEGAYEFALKYIGMDKDSGSIWTDYISLIKEREVKGGWKEGQKMDDLRRVYQRAVSVPVANVEAIWKDYDTYENGLNKLTAKKFLAERSPAYMTARRVLRDLKTRSDNLARPLLPRVPVWTSAPVPGDAGENMSAWEKERAQIDAWKQYLQWEESNPLLLEDLSALQTRVLAAYKKATMFMRFYPEIWYMASLYLTSIGRQEEAATWLKNGIQACSGSFLLHFAYVELAELRKSTADCGAIFDSLLNHIHAKIDARQAILEQTLRKIDTEAQAALAEASAKRAMAGDEDVDLDGEEREQERKMEEAFQEKKEQRQQSAKPEIEGLKEAAALVWIKYMHFVRRTEGIRPARIVFGRARKSPHCTWQVFEASALMEYHCSKDPIVATKVFELALKTYGKDEAYVLRYLDFLISINDDSNARALFERTIATFPADRARPIWDRWAEYEYSFGDAAAIQKLEVRLAEEYPDEPLINRFVDRNSYMDLDMIGPRDLGFQAVIAGASAADRAVAATKDLSRPEPQRQHQHQHGEDQAPRRRTMEEMKKLAAESKSEDTLGAWARPGSIHPSKRVRTDAESPIPGEIGRSTSQGVQKVGPMAGVPTGPAATRNVTNNVENNNNNGFVEIPEAVLFFMDILPSAHLFDGPKFNPEDIIECLRHANLPTSQNPPKGPSAGSQSIPTGPAFTGKKPPFMGRGRGRPMRGRNY